MQAAGQGKRPSGDCTTVPLLAPKPAFFWDSATNGWRPAVPGEPGELVWNATNKSWEPGALGAEYVWNPTTYNWDFGTLGGEYVWNSTTYAWDKVTEAGRGGPYYYDTTVGGWVVNSGASVTQERITDAGDIRVTDAGLVRITDAG